MAHLPTPRKPRRIDAVRQAPLSSFPTDDFPELLAQVRQAATAAGVPVECVATVCVRFTDDGPAFVRLGPPGKAARGHDRPTPCRSPARPLTPHQRDWLERELTASPLLVRRIVGFIRKKEDLGGEAVIEGVGGHEDAEEIALLSLTKAASAFDPGRGAQFFSFALRVTATDLWTEARKGLADRRGRGRRPARLTAKIRVPARGVGRPDQEAAAREELERLRGRLPASPMSCAC